MVNVSEPPHAAQPAAPPESKAAPILQVDDLVKEYPLRGTDQQLRAVAGVSFIVGRGETLGIVGESGCGKSTTARLLVRLEDPTSGRIELGGQDISTVRGRTLRAARRRIQLVFQDPYASLNPRLTVAQTLDEVLRVHHLAGNSARRRERVGDLLSMVGLRPYFVDRYPHQMSGGQRQRVGIARALAVEPDVVVLDEPVSALDVSVQAEVMNLLTRLRDELGLSYVFISHDLGMVRHISDRIAVMYLGRIVEIGPWRPVSDNPLHPYTRALQDAVPVADPVSEANRRIEPLMRRPYRKVIWGDPDNGYVGEVPELPGCLTAGATESEALGNLQEAMEAWLEAAIVAGRPIPDPVVA
jgi:ABC-type oligopeptide transport system ATPase subunit